MAEAYEVGRAATLDEEEARRVSPGASVVVSAEASSVAGWVGRTSEKPMKPVLAPRREEAPLYCVVLYMYKLG